MAKKTKKQILRERQAKPQAPPPPRYQIVAREHDDFGRPELVLDPVTKLPVSTDPENPTSVVMNDWWARRLADRSVTVISVQQPTEQRAEAKPKGKPSKTKGGK
jgi:hypothetical protein